MSGGILQFVLTFGLATASATVFLILRCRGVGRPFGPSSRWHAVLIIVLTGVVSTGVAVAATALAQHLSPALVGAVAPSGLWLGHIRQRGDGRRSVGQEVSTLWLAWLLDRMEQGMAEDRLRWCESRIDESWSLDELSAAARAYHEYLAERLTPDQRRRERIHARLQAAERRLDVATLIEDEASRSKVATALRSSRTTKEPRYERYLTDLPRLAGVLRHDAERDVFNLLSSAYRTGCYRLDIFGPPPREPARTGPQLDPVQPLA